MNELSYHIIKAINAAVTQIFIIEALAQSSTCLCLRDNIFTFQLCFCPETDRKFTQVS